MRKNLVSKALKLKQSYKANAEISMKLETAIKKPTSFWNEHLIKVGNTQDRESFKALYEHFGPLLKSYFMSKFPNQHSLQMMDELVQETMIKVWQKANSYDQGKAAASTWIFTLARNTRIDMLRRQNKYANTTSIETEEIWEDTTENGPYLLLQNNRQADDIQQSLQKLPEEQALVIRKVYMESKSHSEVAEELSLPLGTVKSRVRLAQNKLQALIK
ncbi:MAG: RNA polymerase sigma factor (sigma-70 family) [Cellvibrionaceae bacterium]|jgi:RNA polymerase sigma-70 factor (ECF subfamily)